MIKLSATTIRPINSVMWGVPRLWRERPGKECHALIHRCNEYMADDILFI